MVKKSWWSICEIRRSRSVSILWRLNMEYTLVRSQHSLRANQLTLRSCRRSSVSMRLPICIIASGATFRLPWIRFLRVNKKDVGVSTFRLPQVFRLSHCLHLKDKQLQSAHAKVYYIVWGYIQQLGTTSVDLNADNPMDIIHPRGRFRCRVFWGVCKFCENLKTQRLRP